jgi:hypothetical protein
MIVRPCLLRFTAHLKVYELMLIDLTHLAMSAAAVRAREWNDSKQRQPAETTLSAI